VPTLAIVIPHPLVDYLSKFTQILSIQKQ